MIDLLAAVARFVLLPMALLTSGLLLWFGVLMGVVIWRPQGKARIQEHSPFLRVVWAVSVADYVSLR